MSAAEVRAQVSLSSLETPRSPRPPRSHCRRPPPGRPPGSRVSSWRWPSRQRVSFATWSVGSGTKPGEQNYNFLIFIKNWIL